MICVVFNPAARGHRARRFLTSLSGLGPEISLKPTTGPGAAMELAREAVEDGFETIVAAGGDGTVHETLNGLAAATNGLERARLGILPLGTVNVLARDLGLPLDFGGAWATVMKGRERRIDLPSITYTTAGGRETRRVACIAGAGVDARALALSTPPLKKRWGWVAYVFATLKALRKPWPELEARSAGRTERCVMASFGTGPLYGGPFVFFPGMRLDTGKMGIASFGRLDWWTIMRGVPLVLFGQIGKAPHVKIWQSDHYELRSPDGQLVQVHADGEVVGTLPATIHVQSGALRIIAP
jgi:diacylglycerol kinase (ATP)